MKLVMNYKDLTVRQFMALDTLKKDESIEPIDRMIKRFAILSGKSEDQVSEMSLVKIQKMLVQTVGLEIPPADMPVKKWLRLGSTILVPTLDIVDMKVNQLTDFYSVFDANGRDHIPCLNSLLAIIYRPLRLRVLARGKERRPLVFFEYHPADHARIAKKMLDVKLGDCLGPLFFYSSFWKKCEPIITRCLEKSKNDINSLMEEIAQDEEFMRSLKPGHGNIT